MTMVASANGRLLPIWLYAMLEFNTLLLGSRMYFIVSMRAVNASLSVGWHSSALPLNSGGNSVARDRNRQRATR